MKAYRDILEQLFETASFLWILRSIAVNQPHYYRTDIVELEQRLETQLDGLMDFKQDAWDVCLEGLELEEPGEVFTATVIAFSSDEEAKIQRVIETGLNNSDATRGLISAMGWLPGNLVHPWVKKFLSSKDLNHKYLALAACSVRRENPGEYLTKILQRDDCKQHHKLYARAVRLIGEIHRKDLASSLNEAVNTEQTDGHFWSTYSAILLGNQTAEASLKSYVFNPGPYQSKAVNLAFKVLPVAKAREWISHLVTDPMQSRIAIKATGVLGDPHAINWLIQIMRDPEQARLAAEAFTLITGISLEQNQLISAITPVLTDPEDEDVSIDEDENLAYPDADKVSAIWQTNKHKYMSGQRYFLGQVITIEGLKKIHPTCNQRQRHLADLELAILAKTSLLNHCARGKQ